MKLIPAHRRPTVYFILVIVAWIGLFITTSYDYTEGIRLFPLLVGYFALLLLLLDFLSLTDTRVGRAINLVFSGKQPAEPSEDDEPPRSVVKEIVAISWMATVVLAIYLVGFLPVIPVFVFLWMKIMGGNSVRASLYLAIGTLGFVYLMFEIILEYELYPGVFWF